ncbi:MAG: sulfatase-like hydrolase/transferase [Actinobacteria bacterium]|nr:sulfatase-like hydrolase/transferase [Actinomycetota bacterium]
MGELGGAIATDERLPGISRRQVVLLMTDTTRWDMLASYRDTGLRTPNLDRIAHEGLRFERAYTCQPVCAPARGALFTGTWPHVNGVWANSLALGTSSRSIGEHLARIGVHSAYIGKWHLDGSDYFGNGIAAPGWDPSYWYDGRRYLEELSPADRVRSRQARTSFDPGLSAEFTYAHRCSDRAVGFLRDHAEESFLLVVSYDEPHGPSICPAPYSTMYDDFHWPGGPNHHDPLSAKPELQRVWAESSGAPYRVQGPAEPQSLERSLFFGAQSFVDAEIGRVLDAISSTTPGALVIYTSDHGDALGAHRLANKGPAAYDEIARIPLLVSWPGQIEAGRVHPGPVSHIDLCPTILDVLGCPVPPVMSGRSLVPLMTSGASQTSQHVFVEFGRYEIDHDGFGGFQPMRAVTDERFKLVVNLLDTDELYDLWSDPDELDNLIDSHEHQPARDHLHDVLLEWTHETRDPFRGYQWERRPWRGDAALPTWAGRGMTRQRSEDGFEARQLDYDTGLEMTAPVRPK